ncbi:MAG: hypothetical protein JWQ04_1818, partial [Pedosphaera sp.]|nr:hypothetical protein [Pedosphaera sp.]
WVVVSAVGRTSGRARSGARRRVGWRQKTTSGGVGGIKCIALLKYFFQVFKKQQFITFLTLPSEGLRIANDNGCTVPGIRTGHVSRTASSGARVGDPQQWRDDGHVGINPFPFHHFRAEFLTKSVQIPPKLPAAPFPSQTRLSLSYAHSRRPFVTSLHHSITPTPPGAWTLGASRPVGAGRLHLLPQDLFLASLAARYNNCPESPDSNQRQICIYERN